MSRTYDELTKQQEQQKQLAIAETGTVPAEWQAELDAMREAVAHNGRSSFFGQMMRFRKGAYLLGAEKKKVPEGTRFIGIMAEARHGYRKFVEEVADDGSIKKRPVHIVGKIVDKFVLPGENKLPDRDQSTWKIGLNNKLEDPWKKVAYLPLLSLDGKTVATFVTDTPTGLSRFWNLIDRYQWIGCKHPGKYPVIEPRPDSYHDRRWGQVLVPDLAIVGWIGRPDPAQLLGHNGADAEEPPPNEGDGFDDTWERE